MRKSSIVGIAALSLVFGFFPNALSASGQTSGGESFEGLAQSPNESSLDSSASVETEPPLSVPKIIGTEILGGIMAIEENTTRTRIGLTVNVITDPQIVEWQQSRDIPVASLVLSNDVLGNEDAIDSAIAAKRNGAEQALLREAFDYLSNDSEVYATYWSPDPETVQTKLAGLLDNGDLTGSDYFRLLRDRNIARSLFLKEQKLRYTMSFRPEGRQLSPFDDDIFSVTSEDVRWEVKVYKLIEDTEPEIAYFRFAIRAVAEPHEFLIPSQYFVDEKQPKLSVDVSLQKEEGRSIYLTDEEESFSLDNLKALTYPSDDRRHNGFRTVVDEAQRRLEVATGGENSPNRSNQLLSFIGGPGQLASLIGRALTQSPIQNNSLISGGLVGITGEGGTEALVGVNQGLTSFGDFDLGFLFGATPSENPSMFIGPSLSYSLMTVGVGARISGEESLEFNTAGVISVDLSQLLANDSDNVNRIVLGNTDSEGILADRANAVAQDQMVALIGLNTQDMSPLFRDQVEVYFTRTHSDFGCVDPVDPASEQATVFTVRPERPHLRFLPKGCYVGQLNEVARSLLSTHDFYQGDSPLNVENPANSALFIDGTFAFDTSSDSLQKQLLTMIPKELP